MPPEISPSTPPAADIKPAEGRFKHLGNGLVCLAAAFLIFATFAFVENSGIFSPLLKGVFLLIAMVLVGISLLLLPVFTKKGTQKTK